MIRGRTLRSAACSWKQASQSMVAACSPDGEAGVRRKVAPMQPIWLLRRLWTGVGLVGASLATRAAVT